MSEALTSAQEPPPPISGIRNGRSRGYPVFLLALLFGVVLHLGALAVFRVSLEPASPTLPTPAFIHYAKTHDVAQNEVSKEEEQLFDPESLYLPTAHNFSSQAARPPLVHPPTVVGNADKVQITPNAGDFHLSNSTADPTSGRNDALNALHWSFLQTIGQAPSGGQPLPSHGARLRIIRQGSGTQSASVAQVITWPESMAPQGGDQQWKSTKFSLLFNASSLVGQPLLENSSGNEQVDEDLVMKLQQWFSRHTLPPGLYEVEISP